MDTQIPAKPRLVFVDDEPELRELVAEYIGKERYSVRTAASGVELDRLLVEEHVDLILLDINMPGENGLSILKRIRSTSNTPVIMLTSASDVADKIMGFDIGADAYVTKPFDLRELKARVGAVLRRGKYAVTTMTTRGVQKKNTKCFGKVLVDLDARCLIHADGRSEAVTAMEFDLLTTFLENPDRVLTRDRLLDLVHQRGNDPFGRSIDIRITRIRKKIERDPSKPQTLKTVRGVGYIYTPEKRIP